MNDCGNDCVNVCIPNSALKLLINSDVKFTDEMLVKLVKFNELSKSDWVDLCTWKQLPEWFMIENINNIFFGIIAETQTLSESFIEQYLCDKDSYIWESISIGQKLSDEFIKKHSKKLNLTLMAMHNRLSESLILNFYNEIDWELVNYYLDSPSFQAA